MPGASSPVADPMKLSTGSQSPAADPPRPTPAMLEAAYQQLMAFRELPYLSELTLSLLHKFNNVITGVIFLTEDGMSNTKPGDPVYERLEEIALTLRTSLDSIQQVTRLHLNEQQDDTSFYALEGIIDDELPLLSQLLPKNTKVHFSHGSEPTPVYGSRRAIAEILMHLVGNAGEALSRQNAAIWITIQKHGEESAVSLRDNGPGLSPEVQDRLFTPFATTRSATGHAGLGLYRARMLARKMGGELSLSNHYEAGAEAVLTLPQSAPDTAS